MNRRIRLVIVTVLIVILGVAAKSLAVSQRALESPKSPAQVIKEIESIRPKFSTWMWESPERYTKSEMEQLIKLAANRDIETIFLNVESFINIQELDNDPLEKQSQTANFESALAEFIKIAEKSNIEVWALAGDVDWAFDSHRYIPIRLVKFVNDFNLRNPEANLKGIQFDIEYYNSDTYKEAGKKSKVEYSKEFISLVRLLKDSSTVPMGLAIPYWFNRDDTTNTFEFDSKEQSIFEHLADILDNPDSTTTGMNHLAIMSYRRKTVGNNGTLDIVESLFRILDKGKKNIILYIGQDVATKDRSMSFMKSELAEFAEAANIINAEFDAYSFYGGVAIHDLSDYLKMEIQK